MSAYSELVKNFEKIRSYMRDFYVYGFKSRSEYDRKSSRSYDNERRRMESWLGDHMSFVRTPEGKNMFLSIDSRASGHNPLFKAWKARSFTDGDITLHFILFDILSRPEISLSLSQIIEKIDGEYLQRFRNPMVFDESTVRKKLKEYVAEGMICAEKCGRQTVYRRMGSLEFSPDPEALHFFSETAPCGVIGSFLLDKYEASDTVFTFKHHYITQVMDSDVLAVLFDAMGQKRAVTARYFPRRSEKAKDVELIPLKVLISVQGGRQHLLAYQPRFRRIGSFRLDYLADVKPGEICPEFDLYREQLAGLRSYMWGVSCKSGGFEWISFTVSIGEEEEYIIRRLQREKRIGTVERADSLHYRFYATVCDAGEMIPWIRTFLCRITEFYCSNKEIEARSRNDILEMYRMYGIDGGDTDDLQ